MTASDITVLLGEFAATEIDNVMDVTYTQSKDEPAAFTIFMGVNKFTVEITCA
ncbi:MAG: hypothetical protein WC292_04150 [Clostridia bacterium]